jgi:PAS domain S-box-containing protein
MTADLSSRLRRSQSSARFCAVAAIAIGFSGLAGWALNIGALKSPSPGLVTIKANTAAGIVLCGIALTIMAGKSVGPTGRLGIATLGMITFLLGGLSLSEDIFGWNVGIDQLLVDRISRGIASLNSGRMSPSTSFSFLLLGGAAFLASSPRLKSMGLAVLSALVSVVIAIGIMSLSGTLLGAQFGIRFGDYTGMSLQTAASFILLGFGILAVTRSRGGAGWELDRLTTGGFLIGVISLLALAGSSYSHTHQLLEAASWVNHTQVVLKEIQKIDSGIATLGGSQREYINSGDERLLEPFEREKTGLQSEISTLRKLTVDNQGQQIRLDRLEVLVAKRIESGRQIISARREHGVSAAEELITTASGITSSADVRRVTEEMTDEEYSLLALRQSRQESIAKSTFLLLPLGAFLSLTMLSLGLFSLNAENLERKRLEAGNARLAAIVESSDDAIIGKDLSGTVSSWNAAAERIFGYSASEMIGKSILQIIPKERRDEETRIIDSIRRGEPVVHFETVRLRKDLTAVDIAVTVSAIRDPSGNIVGASKIARDITERKKSDAALRESDGRYRTLFEYAPDGIVIADGESNYIDANTSICRMLGYTRKELIGLHASDIVAQPEIQNIAPALATIKAESSYHREWSFRRKDGSVFEAEVIATNMPDGNLLGMIRDITDRKRAELEKKESEDRLNFALETVHIGEWDLDLVSHVAHRTLEHDRIFGYDSLRSLWTFEMFLGHVMPEDRPQVDRSFREAIAAQSRWDFECRIKRIDGEMRWIWAVGTHVPDKDGKMRRLVGIVQDITDRKKAENTIRVLNEELEQRVADRTAQLEAANRELEAFSYSVSHDLRAPLRAVDGFSQAAIEDFGPSLPAEGRRQLQVISDSAQRMGELIDDLLAFSRLGRQPLNKQTVMTERLVNDTLGEMNAQRVDQKAEIKIGQLPPCKGDSALLKQVWVNLLSNAFKYSRNRDRPVIEVGCFNQGEDQVYFVRDNGCGFDMRYADKLFGVFQRLHRAEEFEGTGVGLAIVHRIVNRHGGRVWAESATDRGATFYFTLSGGSKP